MGLTHSPRIVTDGLILCLDAANTKSYIGSGTAWNDISGKQNNGTIDGATFGTSNQGAFDFDGTNDNIKIPNTAAGTLIGKDFFDGSNNLSLEVWFNADDLPANGGSNYLYSQVLFGGGDRNIFIVFGDDMDDKEVGIRVKIGSTWSSPVGSGVDSIANNTWYNLIITYNASSGFVLYLNGVQKSTSSTTGTFADSNIGDVNNRLLGCLRDDASDNTTKNRFFDGEISLCRIYNRDLTASEAKQNYDAYKGRY